MTQDTFCEQSSRSGSRSGFLPDRTVHLHPLDRCNLACSHCYSSSSPLRQSILPLESILAALPHLRREGYQVLSLSGGEPLLYPWLPELAEAARGQGFRVVAISNGFRVAARHERLVAACDRIAVSFDGMEATHISVRGHKRAWEAAVSALRYLVASGRPAVAAFTVTARSLAEVPEYIDMCAAIGVGAVQLRPLVMAGRAETDAQDLALAREDLGRLWLMGQTLAIAYEGEVQVHTDLAPAPALAADRGAWDLGMAGLGPLSDLINPLVIGPDGALRPFTYDFPQAFALGSLSDLGPRAVWRIRARMPALRAQLDRTLTAAGEAEGFIDWFAFQRDQAVLASA